MADDALTRKEAEMGWLTREKIEQLRTLWASSLGGDERFHALCALALRALSLESVREEALEEAAKVCDAIAFSRECADDTMQGVRDAHPYKQCAATIRDLQHTPARVAEGKEQPWQRTRREVLIEAAMKCRDIQYEHRGLLYENAEPNVKTYHDGMAKGADVCEYAIRNLAESPAKEQPGEQNEN